MPRSKIKNTILAKTYLKNDLNATKTMRKLKPHITNGTAKFYGSKMLNNAGFQRALKDEMDSQGITSEKLTELLNRNMGQENNLPASNTAIDMAFKVRGDYAPEKKLNVNLTLQGKELDKAIKEKLEEIKLLSDA
ncbi:MAG TPA: hypothetical protein ENI13_00830 [candidate division CPR3 bacterium]|uniref:Uncharacterized protein n=1 Tax=candidate division CPR3 bacterium TaxID=2268181 RepID=A0A7C1NSD3_UNCC3|nr:hypothetical protein [candidate division CPR3 bacterium]